MSSSSNFPEELFRQLGLVLTALSSPKAEEFYDSRLVTGRSHDQAARDTFKHLDGKVIDLQDKVRRMEEPVEARTATGILDLSSDSSDEAEDEKPRSSVKRSRRVIESSSESNTPDTSPHTKAKEGDSPMQHNRTKAKPDKKVKREPPQDPVHGQPTPSMVKQETHSKPGQGNDLETKGRSQTGTKQETSSKAADDPSRKLSKGARKKGTAKPQPKKGT